MIESAGHQFLAVSPAAILCCVSLLQHSPLFVSAVANPSIGSLAGSLTSECAKSGSRSIVIFDLRDQDGNRLVFGAWLADQISIMADVDSSPVKIVERSRLAKMIADLHVSPINALTSEVKTKVAVSLGADTYIDGSIGAFKSVIGVTLVATSTTRVSPSDSTWKVMVTGSIPVDGDVSAHLDVPLESLRPRDGIFRAGHAGVTVPYCAWCPSPRFSVDAISPHHAGTILLDAVISPQGDPVGLAVVRSVDAELDKQVIKAVRRWKFKPALDPDGIPITVKMPIGVKFYVDQQVDRKTN